MTPEQLYKCSTKQLIDLWNETEKRMISLELAKVRGWIMDALEAKDSIAFEKWLESEPINGKDQPLELFFNIAA
jgi:hypothetical protein